jgi:tRNA(Arg) A34 adenosine deaminase TadA
MSDKHQIFIQKTYELAKNAVRAGNHPFGALATLNQEVIALAQNNVVTANDNTKHAELNLASMLSQTFPKSTISKMIIYCSNEPCPMCAGALFWVGCRHIVYGCSVETLDQYTSKAFSVKVCDSLSSVRSRVKIEGPLAEKEGDEIHKNFWPQFE